MKGKFLFTCSEEAVCIWCKMLGTTNKRCSCSEILQLSITTSGRSHLNSSTQVMSWKALSSLQLLHHLHPLSHSTILHLLNLLHLFRHLNSPGLHILRQLHLPSPGTSLHPLTNYHSQPQYQLPPTQPFYWPPPTVIGTHPGTEPVSNFQSRTISGKGCARLFP